MRIRFLRRMPLGRWRWRRLALTVVVMVILFLLWVTHYEPLTVSGILKHTNLYEERESKQVLAHPQLKCKKQSMKNTVVMVLSKASNSLRRETIRHTWGHPEMQMKYNFSLYFVLGNDADLHKPHITNGDILHVDINEDYYHITEKVIEAFNWVTHYCYESRFFFKIDDDVYFNLKFLQEVRKDETYLPDDVVLGTCLQETKPFRMTTKFRVSYDEYPFEMYPPYCGGPGYVMTLHTAYKLYREMVHTKTFKFEDVYVGLVAYKLGIYVQNVDHFVYAMDGFFHGLSIQCARITHNLTPDVITKLWIERDKKVIGEHDCSSLSGTRYIIKILFGVFSI